MSLTKLWKFLMIIPIIFVQFSSNSYSQSTEELQREFTSLRFGMFIHFGIRTFTGAKWATPSEDPSKFNPKNLDCNQWAEAAAAAKMKFAILTTKHHDGFCLWNSKYTKNSVAGCPWKKGNSDVVREFVDAFRAHGLYPCLYYSIWDNTAGIGNVPINAKDMKVIEGQLTELLTNYGKIKLLFIDGWSWKMGHVAVPYEKIRALIKNLQPGCLLVDNTHFQCLYENDMVHLENGTPFPSNNTLPVLQSMLIYKNGGNGWFWNPKIGKEKLLSVSEIVDTLHYLGRRWGTLILNCPPNTGGKLDSNIVERLQDVGKTWSPDTNLPPLPKQAKFINYPVMPYSAWATSGKAANAIDGINDRYFYSVWQSNTSLPQSITIDLGKIYNNICILNYVPQYKTVATPVRDGSIESYKIYASIDNKNYNKITQGTWNGNTLMKVATFKPTPARYIKIEALTAVDGYAAATEFEIGRENLNSGLENSQGKITPDLFKLEQNCRIPPDQTMFICNIVKRKNFKPVTICY